MLLRLLFPSWAFFDAVTEVPALEACVRDGAGRDAWRAVLQAPSRSLLSLLYNPEGTTHLALQGVVDRLAVECEHGAVNDVTRDLVAAIAEGAVREWGGAGEPSRPWAWRVVATPVRDRFATPRVLCEHVGRPLGAPAPE